MSSPISFHEPPPDWATVFPLTGFTRTINVGDTVSFTFRSPIQIGAAQIGGNEVGVEPAMFNPYAPGGRSRFYLKK